METKTTTNGTEIADAPPRNAENSAPDAHHEDYARRRLLHDAVGLPDEPPFHIGFDLMTTLESDEAGGTDDDPTDTLLKRALEQIHIAQELDDRRLAAAEAKWIREFREKGVESTQDRSSIRRGLAEKALSLAEGLIQHAARLHRQQADVLTRRILGQPQLDRTAELGFDHRDPEHVERVIALRKAGLL